MNRETDKKGAIRGFIGKIAQLAFSTSESRIMLTIVDELGNFQVHEIRSTPDAVETKAVLTSALDPAGRCRLLFFDLPTMM